MPLHTIPFPDQTEAEPNVRITNATLDAENVENPDWIILVIERIGTHQYPGIAIMPNEAKDIALPAGNYHFFFTFQKQSIGTKIAFQALTSHGESPFPDEPRVVSTNSGAIGQTGITVQV